MFTKGEATSVTEDTKLFLTILAAMAIPLFAIMLAAALQKPAPAAPIKAPQERALTRYVDV